MGLYRKGLDPSRAVWPGRTRGAAKHHLLADGGFVLEPADLRAKGQNRWSKKVAH